MPPAATPRRTAWLFLGVMAVLYAAVVVAAGGLAGPPIKDEEHYWPASQHFSERLIPTLEQLRDYEELSTPLAYVVWGQLEFVFGGGIAVGRAFVLVLSVAMVIVLGLGAVPVRRRAVLATVGLLVFPYYLLASVVLYPDIVAAAGCLGAVMAYRAERHAVSALCCVAAIATRQYMIAFPLALGAHAFFQHPWRIRWGWIAQGLATLSMLGWVWLFGGLSPESGLALKPVPAANVAILDPANGLYLLVCIGAYFVLPELLLLGGWTRWRSWMHWRLGVGVGIVVVLFVLFPPFENAEDYSIPTMGYLDRAVRLVLPDALRIVFFGLLATLATARFVSGNAWRQCPSLETWLVLANAVVLAKGILAWDKYALPLLVTLWYIESRRAE